MFIGFTKKFIPKGDDLPHGASLEDPFIANLCAIVNNGSPIWLRPYSQSVLGGSIIPRKLVPEENLSFVPYEKHSKQFLVGPIFTEKVDGVLFVETGDIYMNKIFTGRYFSIRTEDCGMKALGCEPLMGHSDLVVSMATANDFSVYHFLNDRIKNYREIKDSNIKKTLAALML